ncbi:MAG TPA: twin-arginine translocase subunit TatC [Syntrophorhabdus sp.]|jgi:sec-independent protein translocase protein TatC|nr:twin-arginine translocase subunit TatC [Syntrophorhabdus sp.]MDI9558166.1 twin-arginine translocase subunit TatC [Pseudomonadota bacterium]OPX92758.1 MAG: Sec-independent protein translocase protein TatC [Syntrophorhabdus sp. PtaB.Bin027]OQB77844.1 MAG: Sec-independent protein translocase protein TatC [Deltaproteobacteria bacterium ADurb.Bin135]HNQ47469.1 twin-arginine translocase subunit TatC [Syntrophorhabdus sp.]
MGREKIVLIMRASKKFVLKALIVVAVTGSLSFFFSKKLLGLLLQKADLKIYYLSLPEVFLSSIELSIYAGLFFAIPIVIYLAWYEFHVVSSINAARGYMFIIMAIVLFYAGSIFCYSIVLPSGIKFLVAYGKDNNIMAMISMQRFVTFCSAMIFAFGFTFEVPIVLLALGKAGLVRSKSLTKTRRFAVLFIVISAAIITPTPDIYNLALLAVPTYLLYEIGILLMKINERRKGIL